MKYRMVNLLVCPFCQGALRLKILAQTKSDILYNTSMQKCSDCFFSKQGLGITYDCHVCYRYEIIDGILCCCCCRKSYPIVSSIPVMLPVVQNYFNVLIKKYGCTALSSHRADTTEKNSTDTVSQKTQDVFGFEWNRYPLCFEDEEKKIFLEETQIEPSSIQNKLVLDAGCGMGRFTRIAGKFGCEVIGLDISSSVYTARKATKNLPCVHIVQGDLLRPPFRDGLFDIIYSLGVLHHTPDTKKAFSALTKKLRKGGTFSLWVYGSAGAYENFITNPLKPSRAKFIRNASFHRAYWILVLLREKASNLIRKFTVHTPKLLLYLFCYVLAFIGRIPILKYFTASVHRDLRVRVLENFDWLSPPYQHHHTKEEVMGWFEEEKIQIKGILKHGFIPKVGITGVRKV